MDLSHLSDADLDRMIAEAQAGGARAIPASPAPSAPAAPSMQVPAAPVANPAPMPSGMPAPPPDLSGMSDADLDAAIAKSQPLSIGGRIEDAGRSLGAGLGRGFTGLPGVPADLASMVTGAYDWADAKLRGLTPEQAAKAKSDREANAILKPETLTRYGSASFIDSAKPYVPGMDYQPKTTVGEYGKTLGEFAPNLLFGPTGGVRGAVASTVLPALTSETAGQLTKGTQYEPWARAGGAVFGGFSPKVITPNSASPDRARAVNALMGEDIPMTAGQRTGNGTLQRLEQELGGGRYQNVREEQGRAFTGAAMGRAGERGELATPEVMDRAFTRLGAQFDDLSSRSSTPLTPQLQNDLLGVAADYGSVARNPAAIVEQTVNRVAELSRQNGGVLSGEAYKSIRSDLSRHIKTADPETKGALHGIQSALDDAVGLVISPADQAAWSEARNQYRNLVTLERAVGGAGEAAAQGRVSPAQLRTAAANEQGKRAYVRGEGDFADLARSGVATLTDPPNSGTASRLSSWGLPAAGAGAGATIGNLIGWPTAGAVVGAAMPHMVGRAVMSGPAQAYLGNQLMANMGPEMSRAALVNAMMQAPPILKDRK